VANTTSAPSASARTLVLVIKGDGERFMSVIEKPLQ
ncbi:MAG: hypothetical protein RLZZ620_766, partial [Pseudomonadota bacterium]